ncbi:MAG: UvrABC system protein A [Candidatus Sericytochromatia bacterium]|nr:MAG: UvrABC system protein A [Candidatus Sericytochromatia bacterium]
MNDKIIIKGAREHNLKNINLEIPKNKLVVFTGVSGSGKSSLAFDTIFTEGQRRYIESLSSYARQFIGKISKPDVDYIEGLSPAISIDQKSTSHNPRSTVGTVTEIYDYLRLLYAKIGIPHCYKCGNKINPQTIDQIIDSVMNIPKGTKIQILSPIVRGKKGEHKNLIDEIKKDGFSKIKIDNKLQNLDEEIILDKNKKHNISIVIDRLLIKEDSRSRVAESIETALNKSNGLVIVDKIEENVELLFSQNYSCPDCNINIEEISPRTFSFNSPYGACPKCHGLGFKQEIDKDKIINLEKSINQGALIPWSRIGSPSPFINQLLSAVAKTYKFDLDTPFKYLSDEIKNLILYGSDDEKFKIKGDTYTFMARYEGLIPNLEKRYSETESELVRSEIEKYMTQIPCSSCNGKRLKNESLAVKVDNKSIIDVTEYSIDDFFKWINNLKLTKRENIISQQVLKEIKERTEFLINVGLNYLTLSRSAMTLSGGEAQRIRLATQIGSGLTGVLYVLDEPSIGLHQRDNARLINTLKKLRDLGNTVIVVEHDKETIEESDYIIDIGPKAGLHGGNIVAQGSLKDIINNRDSITSDYLSGRKKINIPTSRRKGNNKFIEIKNAYLNNLKNIDVKIPLGKIVCITGVSGSGKSTLINEILYPYIKYYLHGNISKPIGVDEVKGLENIDKVVNIDQSPIGRTPRSNPVTYTGVFDDIRELFSNTTEAKIRGYKAGRFSFNLKGGRCENCSGDGILKIEMNFLPDVYVTCEVCNGKRYNKETLEVKYKDKNIYDILNMSVDEAISFFENIPRIYSKLKTLYDVGLDYIKLGQPATTLSGGEAQRIKLASELNKRSTGKTIYLLDEPTTGLHFYDVEKLINILNKLANSGNTIIIIEHNLDIIKISDYIIDLGPEGGINGGKIVAEGTPEEVSNNKNSFTGFYLKKELSLNEFVRV